MKYLLPLVLVFYSGLMIKAQENTPKTDSFFLYEGLTKEECPQEFLTAINNDTLRSKAVLFVLNESLHPLGRYEFFDNGVRVRSLLISIRMNRCTMLYIDSGVHRYHTVYQQLKKAVNYEAGKIYIARLFSRTIWPIGGISVIKKNEKGEKVEYAAVLFEYINTDTAKELYDRMKKKEIIVNE